MRLVIDLQGAQTGSRFRGIGRYTTALTKEIIRQGAEHEIILVLNDAFPETIIPLKRLFGALLPVKSIRVWRAPGDTIGADDVSTRRRRHAEIIYECFLASLQPDVILVTSLFEGMEGNFAATVKATSLNIPTAVICYDFIPMHDPDIYLPNGSYAKALYMEKLDQLGRADLLLAISEFVSLEAAERLPAAQREIVNIAAACDDVFKSIELSQGKSTQLKTRLKINGNFIVTSGSLEPHKNLHFLFEAFANVSYDVRESYQLLITGKHDSQAVEELIRQAKSAGLDEKYLVFSGFLSDEDLVTLYADACLMVFPSLDEGFGLPPLEAMSCGTPTLVARAASLPEVAGIPEAMFDPKDHMALADQMARALSDEQYRSILIENAERQAATFSWERTARLALKALQALSETERRQSPTPADQVLDLCLQSIASHSPVKEEIDDLSIALAMVFPDPKQKRRLFVDVSTIIVTDARTGCQRVTRSILTEWMNNPPADVDVLPVYAKPNEAVFFHARKYGAQFTRQPVDGIDLPIDFAPGDVFFGLDLHAHITTTQAAFLSQMHRMGVRVLFMVYDLLPLELPEFFVVGTIDAFNRWTDIITRYDGIVGISQASADAVSAWHANNPQADVSPEFEYHAVHLGADIENSMPTQGIPADAVAIFASMAARPCFLMTGTLEPRKGQAHALDAFECLWAQGHDVTLLIVGKKGWRIDEFADRLRAHPEMGKRLFWLEGISDEYLQQIYTRATCLIAASWGEGFGLPLIEAAHHGTPILARDLPVFREVAGDYASYFDTESADGLATAIVNWLVLQAAGTAPQSEGMPMLTWAECAKKISDILLGTSSDLKNIQDVET